jgi:hypothetical protein
MEPKTGPKIGPKSGSQNATPGAKFVPRRKQGRVDMIFIQWSSTQRSYSTARNKPTTSIKEGGNLGQRNCSNKEHFNICRPNMVKTQDMFFLAEDTKIKFHV